MLGICASSISGGLVRKGYQAEPVLGMIVMGASNAQGTNASTPQKNGPKRKITLFKILFGGYCRRNLLAPLHHRFLPRYIQRDPILNLS